MGMPEMSFISSKVNLNDWLPFCLTYSHKERYLLKYTPPFRKTVKSAITYRAIC